MPRNLDRRVEVMVPIEDPVLHTQVQGVLDTCLRDNRQAWLLHASGQYERLLPGDEPVRATHAILVRDPWGMGGDGSGGAPWVGDTSRTGEHPAVPNGGRTSRGRKKGRRG
jgi:polyphosphate kinase